MRRIGNPVRGEVMVMLDGSERTLCLTFGALAEIEAILSERIGGGPLVRGTRVRKRLRPNLEAARVLAALLRGGGEAEAAAAVEAGGVSPGRAEMLIGQAFAEALV